MRASLGVLRRVGRNGGAFQLLNRGAMNVTNEQRRAPERMRTKYVWCVFEVLRAQRLDLGLRVTSEQRLKSVMTAIFVLLNAFRPACVTIVSLLKFTERQ